MDRRVFYNERAAARPRELQRGYHRLLEHYYSSIIPAGARVLEVGCGIGDLLYMLKPSRGVGVDFSPAMIELARARNPNLHFICADGHTFKCDEQFDFIVLSDLVNDVEDVQALLENLRHCSHSGTRVVINYFNNLWRPGLQFAEAVGWKAPTRLQSWLSNGDMRNLLDLAGWEVITTQTRILWPSNTPVIGDLLNRWLAPLVWPLNLTIFQVARLAPSRETERDYSCTVVVPARNEAGNIEAAVLRTPQMGKGTELIFIEGHSKDDTWDEIQRVIAKYPERNIVALKQQTKGKGGAVREAFARATGELLFILDADLTMPPEQLPKFYEAARSAKGEFINGVRLVYPMEEEAMQFLNMVANKTFGILFSWLMGQPVKDTLCGTKVLLRQDYERIAANRAYFGDFDPFGDFDLLFGASKLNLKITDMPIRYAARTYGETNIHRWRHGWLLLRMVIFAAKRLKFI